MKIGNIIAGIMLITISVIFYLETYKFPVKTGQTIGPASWPRFILITLAFLSAVLIVNSFKKKVQSITAKNKNDLNEEQATSKKILKPILGMLTCFIFMITFKKIGFIISVFFLHLILTSIIQDEWNYKSIITMVAQALIIVLTVYILFEKLLRVNLPQGIFFF